MLPACLIGGERPANTPSDLQIEDHRFYLKCADTINLNAGVRQVSYPRPLPVPSWRSSSPEIKTGTLVPAYDCP